MIDRRKVEAALHCQCRDLMHDTPACDTCMYCKVKGFSCDTKRLFRDILTLFKEQIKEDAVWELADVYDQTAWRCSACGNEWIVDGNPGENGMNYCPGCGARMAVIQIPIIRRVEHDS